jgi:hypothetical protein
MDIELANTFLEIVSTGRFIRAVDRLSPSDDGQRTDGSVRVIRSRCRPAIVPSLGQPLLLDWVLWMRGSLRDSALRVHVG